jgi:hypothetical protein
LEYIPCGKYGSPTPKGEQQLGNFSQWWAIDCLPKEKLLEVAKQ